MSAGSVWTTLGIEQTTDRTAIRRAYAARLKVIDPQADPGGFQALRFAYERCLAMASPASPRRRPSQRPPGRPEPFKSEPETAEAPEPRSESELVLDDPPSPDTPGPKAARERLRPYEPDPGSRPPPPEPPQPSASQQYERALGTLAWSLTRPDIAPADLVAQFEAIVRSSIMEQVGFYVGAEARLSTLIAQSFPRSDPLVSPAIDHFGWRARERAHSLPPAVAAILARARDTAYLASIRQRGHPMRGYLRTLERRPNRGDFLLNLVIPAREANLKRLLNTLANEHPALMEDLPAESAHGWIRYSTSPRISAPSVWSALICGLVLAVPAGLLLERIGAGSDFRLALGISLATCLAFLPVKVFGYDRAAQLWVDRWSGRAPAWLKLGWAPAAVALMVIAAILPGGWDVGVAAAGAALILWAMLTRGGTLDAGKRFAPPIRPTPRPLFLAICFVLLLTFARHEVWMQTAVALITCIFISTRRRGTLDALWADTFSAKRRTTLQHVAVALMILAGVAYVGRLVVDASDEDSRHHPPQITIQLADPAEGAAQPATHRGPDVELGGLRVAHAPPLAQAAHYYPPDALNMGLSGEVELNCRLSDHGALTACTMIEEPPGAGFGAAALTYAREIELSPADAARQPVRGGFVHLTIRFEPRS